MQGVSYHFNYSGKEDKIGFSFQVGLQTVSITLGADSFFRLCDSIIASGEPFFEAVKKKRAKGTKEDVEFNLGEWDKIMNNIEGEENGNKAD